MLNGRLLHPSAKMLTVEELIREQLVLEFVEEYRYALEMDDGEPENLKWFHQLMDLEDFFHSDLFAVMYDIDPDYLLDRLWMEHKNNRSDNR